MKIRKDIKDFRKSKGFKAIQDLLSTIYENLSEQDKSKLTEKQKEKAAKGEFFFQKSIQRLENNFVASEKTADMYRKALKVERNDITADKENNSIQTFKLEPYNLEQINSYRDLVKLVNKSKKRKIILDFDENYLLPGQGEIINELIKYIDKARINQKNMSSVFEADSFEAIKKIDNPELKYGSNINEILKWLKDGREWLTRKNYEDRRRDYQYLDEYETDAAKHNHDYYFLRDFNKSINLIPSQNEHPCKPIFLKAAEFKFWSYWPCDVDTVSQNPAEIVYDANLPKNKNVKKQYITKILEIDYLLLIFSHNKNLTKYTVANPAYNSVISVINKDLNSLKFINKKINANFEEVENIIKSNPELYPRNYLEESDINLIFSDPSEYLKMPEDYEDFAFAIQENSEKIFDKIVNDKRFLNYLMNQYPFAKDNNIEVGSEKIPVKEINKDRKSRLSFMKKTNLTGFLMEDIRNVFTYYFDFTFKGSVEDLIQKVAEIFLVGGDDLNKELKKTRPITEIY